ncbi:MAG TPA: serine hydrolase domain-containing protein [Bryobacteraceae bacterium]|nr:serine hydrolase domain-containing protein [Bryobacteraceae bacterium]
MKLVVSVLLSAAMLTAADLTLDHPDPNAAGMSADILEHIPLRMKEFVSEGKTAGVVTVVARKGQVASVETVGYQSLEKKTPMRADTLFRIASLTKPVTCAAIMILVDEGHLSLRDPVEKYLPEYKGLRMNSCGTLAGFNCAGRPPARPINIEDLMTHTSGLPSSLDSAKGEEPKTLAELVARGAKTELLFEPGTEWNYSNLGIDLLGRIVEVIAKQPFDRFLRERIFEPLGMKDTFFFVPPEKRSRLASLYTYQAGKLILTDADWGEGHGQGIPSPAGGLVSSALDLLRFNEMMREGGSLGGRRILSPAAVHLMTISHTGDMKAGWSPGVGHGYGYEVVRDVEGMFRYSSLGTFCKGGAYRTYEFVDPKKELVGIILMQRTNGGDVDDEINSFMQISAAAVTGPASNRDN